MKKNYYSIHKNKKKRKSIRRSQIDTLRFLNAVNGFVYALMNLRSAIFGMMPIPKYKTGSSVQYFGADLAHVDDRVVESVVSADGNTYTLKPQEGNLFPDPIFTKNNEDYHIVHTLQNIKPPLDFNAIKGNQFQKYINEGKISLIKPNPDLLNEIKNVKPAINDHLFGNTFEM